ncbi:hypothetical protein D3C75_1270610 [compost metagenome]
MPGHLGQLRFLGGIRAICRAFIENRPGFIQFGKDLLPAEFLGHFLLCIELHGKLLVF